MNLDQLLAHLKKLAATLSAEADRRRSACVFVAVVGVVVGSAYWMSTRRPTRCSFADMDAETGGVGRRRKLKDDKVPYQLDDGGRSVRVPAERVDELRLQFASQRPAVGRPHRLRDLRPHRVRHDRVPRARQLPPRARRRAGADDRARSPKWPARACTSRWRRTRSSSSDAQPAKASVVLKLQEQPAAGAGDGRRHRRPRRGQRRVAAARSRS